MSDYLTTDAELTSIANAIRMKGGTSEQLEYPTEFVSAIQAISIGTDVSDTTAVAADVRSGKYFYKADGTKTQGSIADGTITNNTSGGTSSGTINRGSQIKIGKGYYANDTYYTAQSNSGTKNITSSGTTSVDGYANVSVSAGNITNNTSGGTSSGTINRGSQIKIGAGYYANDAYYIAESNSGSKAITSTGSVSVDGYSSAYISDDELVSGNIKNGVNILGIDGSYMGETPAAGTITNNATKPSGTSSSGTISRGTYIKIGAGYYDSDLYYYAQANSSTKTISSSGTTTVNGYYYASVAAGAYSASVDSHSITTTPVVTGSVSGTITDISSTTKPSGTDGTNYWTITPSGSVTTTGVSSATGKATVGTAGYIAAGSNTSSTDTVNITPSVSNGTTRYISKGAITNNTSGGTSSGTVNRGSQIKIGAGYYPSALYYTAQSNSGTKTITASGTTSVDGYANVSVSAGSITNNTSGGTSSGTINRGSQIKIGKGYYASDAYYTAQSNSGTKNITTSGTTSVDGYANVSVSSGSATTPATTVTANPTITVGSSGLITATASATKSVTPTVSSGFVSSGTAGTITVDGSNTKQLTTKAATTYNTSTTNQTIASGTYLTGTQTIRAVTTSNLTAANIKSGVTVKVGDAGSATRIANITGTYTGETANVVEGTWTTSISSDGGSGRAYTTLSPSSGTGSSVTIALATGWYNTGDSGSTPLAYIRINKYNVTSGGTATTVIDRPFEMVADGWSNGTNKIRLKFGNNKTTIATLTISAP